MILVNNQYVLGGTRSFLRQQRMALLPAVLHPAPRRVAFIGLGTGISAGGALVDPAVESVTALEISPLVADLSRRYFDEESDHFASDPRAHVVLEDGRIAVAAATDAYDLIVGDLLLPWQVGAGRLYSVEHFRAVRRALAPGGEFCQWLPIVPRGVSRDRGLGITNAPQTLFTTTSRTMRRPSHWWGSAMGGWIGAS